MNPGYLPGKLMCAYHVFVRPLYQRNGVTFDKIGYYYPFLLSPQGVARPALARCFVSSSFNCSSRDRQVFVELGGGGKKGKKKNGRHPLRHSSPFLPFMYKISERERARYVPFLLYFEMIKKKKKRNISGDRMRRNRIANVVLG